MAGFVLAGLIAPASLAQEAQPQSSEGDSVSARLGRLEQKVKDLQVMIGTLELFVSTKPGAVLPQEAAPAAPQSSAGDLARRIDALETQITALTNHIEQMGKQMSALQAKLAAAQMPPPAPETPNVAEPAPERQGEAPPPSADTASSDTASADNGDTDDPSKPRWYGPKPGGDARAALLERQAAAEPQNPALPSGDAQTLYQQGYGALLQKDYGGAEVAFKQVVDAYPERSAGGQRAILARRDLLRARPIQERGRRLPQGLQEIQVGRQSAGHAAQARHGAGRARPEGCGLLDAQRAHDRNIRRRRSISAKRPSAQRKNFGC